MLTNKDQSLFTATVMRPGNTLQRQNMSTNTGKAVPMQTAGPLKASVSNTATAQLKMSMGAPFKQ